MVSKSLLRRRVVHAVVAALLAAPISVVPARAEVAVDDMAAARTEPLGIVTRNGRRAFKVEVMRSDADRARGLMFRKVMAPDRGMLFDFEQVQPVSMWMKNTYLPLDMVFIRPDGTVARVAADTEPLSTKVIPSGEPVLAVLELNAGTAEKLGIRTGDRVEHALFKARGGR
ncbi:DUF192 domain-containing protein [Methylobacterium haplocladii]|uniref:DUF192 domain-containing protein n=1 Tax=Methylobacterium haplocladii TaxID=1176176 RepID=A0A512IKQ3_9HYPH|nr:DUF192 domain-containing protein [Methylobacterium haplocladii]GEO98296.1 hypothetical protein MHA02_06840 [Methylobacterium haplocladii]GJD84310.1 hypothetical protein HPGCJGGD_2186 [Methylobacterium haplocladii]GLS58410.1 hypothetical protein GCM10007887_10700 [Methylobacterium haplocladii]